MYDSPVILKRESLMKTPAFWTVLPANVHLLIALFLADYQQISDSLSTKHFAQEIEPRC